MRRVLFIYFSFMSFLLMSCWPFKFAPEPEFYRRTIQGIFVDKNSNALNPNGKSWAQAFKTIEAGVKAAKAGQKIYIAAGVYKSPEIMLIDKKNLELIGGYKSGEIYEKNVLQLKPDDWVILDGENKSGTLIEIGGKTQNISLFGLALKNVRGGSALAIMGDTNRPVQNILISRCRFFNNSADTGAGAFIAYAENVRFEYTQSFGNSSEGAGGVLYAEDVVDLVVSNSVLLMNRAEEGGAIFLKRCQKPKFDSLAMEKNLAGFGGAIAIHQSQDIKVSLVTFKKNKALQGAGLFIAQSADVGLFNATFLRNAAEMGAGIFFEAALGHVLINKNEYKNNRALFGSGLIFCGQFLKSRVTISHSFFTENDTKKGAAVMIFDTSSLTNIFNTKFLGNLSNAENADILMQSSNDQAKFVVGPQVKFN